MCGFVDGKSSPLMKAAAHRICAKLGLCQISGTAMFGAHFLTDGGETRNDLQQITDRSCYKDQEASSFVRFGRRTEKLCPGKVADDMLPHNCCISPAIDRIGLIPSGTDRYCKKGISKAPP